MLPRNGKVVGEEVKRKTCAAPLPSDSMPIGGMQEAVSIHGPASRGCDAHIENCAGIMPFNV